MSGFAWKQHQSGRRAAVARVQPAIVSPAASKARRGPAGPGKIGLGAEPGRIPMYLRGLAKLRHLSAAGASGRRDEQEAERIADSVVQAQPRTAPTADRPASSEPVMPRLPGSQHASDGARPLPEPVLADFEPRFGRDLSAVRVHTDAGAARLNEGLGAEAFTYGRDIYFNQGRFAPDETAGRHLLAHELAHVSQQAAAGSPSVQRRLLLTGTPVDIASFLAMCETASGLVLVRDPATNEVTAIASSAIPGTSPSFEAQLTRIMNDPAQNAEINVGQDQPNVDIGAFPQPTDLTAGGVQTVDMDDINAMEAGAPGIGVADLLHEIVENFEAHAAAPVAGVDLFPAAHEAGLQAEADVAADIVGSGRRVAQASEQIGTVIIRIAEDYDTYYVLSTLTVVAARNSFTRSNVSFAPKVNVINQTVDGFITDSDVVPATGAAGIAAVVAALAANPLATVRIEGFTDDRGQAAHNLDLGRRRAESAAAALVAAGVDGGRIQIEPRGATGFAAPNTSEANRAQNRRVVFTVTRP